MAATYFRLVALLGTVALALIGVPRLAYACSGAPFDPNNAAVIAEGWVQQVTLRPDLPSRFPIDPGDSKASGDPFVPVEVVLRIERFLKGSASNPVTFFDARSVYRALDGSPVRQFDGSVLFAGGSGACGILDADPSGQYALIVFGRDADGRLTVHRLYRAAFDDGPDGLRIQLLRQYLTQRLRPEALPHAGEGTADLRVLALVAGGMIALGALLFGTRQRPVR